MNTEFQVSKCKKCGVILSEPKHEERTPCPECGEMKRIHDEALTDGIAVYDHMRMKGRHDGKGKPFFDARVGADFYFKEKQWRHLERVIDRDNKLYVEIIKDMKTGKIIKEVREPLPDHQGHGAAKQKQAVVEKSTEELRKQLSIMTQNENVAEHEAILASITEGLPNSIKVLPSTVPLDRYTCIVHMFDFTEKPEYVDIAKFGTGRVFAGTEFVHWMLHRGELKEIQSQECQKGDIILYFASGKVAHGGLVTANWRVVSKWGIGLLCEHEVFEIPAKYGEDVRYFQRPPYETVYDLFCQYAEESGIVFAE